MTHPVATTLPFLKRAMRRIYDAQALDRPAAVMAGAADAALHSATVDSALRGEWLGHALHPLLTDLPLGAWTSVSLLDVFGGRRARPAATGLLAFGIATALPTALSGLAEWRRTTGATRRAGVAHAIANSTALALYTFSLVARLRGGHRVGTLLAIAGGVAATAGGYLGGHLSIALKVGTADPSTAPAG